MKDCDYPYIELTGNITHSTSDDDCTRCPICNKVFYIPSIITWAYKTTNDCHQTRYLCSWSCLNKAKELIKPSRKYKERY